MAHELQSVLEFFEKFGDDAFRRFDGTVHNMKGYAEAVKKFIKKESVDVKLVVKETDVKKAVEKVVEATKQNVAVLETDLKAIAQNVPEAK